MNAANEVIESVLDASNEAFKDSSKMGVISSAAIPEKVHQDSIETVLEFEQSLWALKIYCKGSRPGLVKIYYQTEPRQGCN